MVLAKLFLKYLRKNEQYTNFSKQKVSSMYPPPSETLENKYSTKSTTSKIYLHASL